MSQTRGRHLAREPRRRPSGLTVAAITLIVVVVAAAGIGGFALLNRPASESTCPGGRVALRVIADPDQAGLLKQVAGEYTNTTPVVGDRCVDVSVLGLDSPEATVALGTGWNGPNLGPRPDVWVPASSTWASELDLQFTAARRPSLLPDERPSVVTSPLVIAMPKPMAQAVGWPQQTLGWGDLIAALSNPEGWRAFGHPEWGQFKLGKTDPKLSEAGLGALLGAGIALAGQGKEPTLAELASKASELGTMMLELSRSPGDEVDTTSTLLANLRRADQAGDTLSYVSAIPLSEKSVWDYNQGKPIDDPSLASERPKPKVPLAAIYPKDGTLQFDYPWIVLRAPWVDDAKRTAATDFLLYLKSPSVQAKFQAAGFRSARGQPGPAINEPNGLLPDQPTKVLAPPAPQMLAATLKGWDQTKRVANLLAVYDVSGSMAEIVPGTGVTKMELARRAASSSLRLFTTESDIGVWEFSTGLDGPRDYRQRVPIGPISARMADGRTRLELLREQLLQLAPTNGDTGLYDTTLAAYQYLKQHYVADRLNLVVLFTDGRNDDPGGGISLSQLLQRLRDGQKDDRKVRILTFAYGKNADVSALKQISDATGGSLFIAPNPVDIERVFVTALANF
ncbi:MAG TPA: substrate-binding domain-containing protein [Actinomycetes bacterium]|nr:substrate-binding domain-containing protein [Actinomycetes bacterium]